ncbi:MAG: glycoside hydrolase family 3 N-terminal domain-containing protein [Bdellovibrio sp.]
MSTFLGKIFLQFFFAFTTWSEPHLSISQKAGQMMMVGLRGPELTQEEEILLRKIQPGAILIFERNIRDLRQLSSLNRRLDQILRAEKSWFPLIALDQEGGRVVRVRTSPSFPSPRAFGLLSDPSIAIQYWNEIHWLLRSLGFHMNLAPVLDVLPESGRSFIRDRAFSSDEKKVASMGVSFAMSAIQSKIIPTAKHFPGSGHVEQDPHFQLTEARAISAEELYSGLSPFRVFADLQPSAMMLSHIIYPNLEPSRVPATYSPLISRNLLREKWGYRGLIITDDLQMKGAHKSQDLGSLAVKALRSGSDLVMVSWSLQDQMRVHKAIEESMHSGELSSSEVFEKMDRLRSSKNLVQWNRERPPFAHSKGRVYSSARLRELDQKMLDANWSRAIRKLGKPWPKDAYWTVLSQTPQFGKILQSRLEHVRRTWTFQQKMGTEPPDLSAKEHLLVAVTRPEQWKWIQTWSSEVKKKTLVLLLADVTMGDNQEPPTWRIELFHPHQGLAPKLTQLLSPSAKAE